MTKILKIQPLRFNNILTKLFSLFGKNKTNQSSISPKENKRFVYIIPELPWSVGEFPHPTLDEDIHSQPLLLLLKQYLPALYTQWRWQVVESARLVKAQTQQLNLLEQQQRDLGTQMAANQAALEDISFSQPKFIPTEQETKPQDPWYLPYWTIGISFMLFLGMCEYFGVKLNNFNGEDLPLLLVSMYGAVAFTFLEKLGVQSFVESSRKYEPKRSYKDDSLLNNHVAFWDRYKAGDSALWIATGFVLLETAFAAPGLLSKMPQTLAAQLFTQVTVAAAAGLAAYANIVFAWGAAIKKIDWLRDRAECLEQQRQWQVQAEEKRAKDPQTEVNRKYRTDAAAASHRLKLLERQIADQKAELADITEKARTEHERWELEVKRWLWENAEKVEESYRNIQAKGKSEADYSSKNPTNGHFFQTFDQYK